MLAFAARTANGPRTPGGRLVRVLRLRVAKLLKQRGWTAYRLAKESGLTLNQAYRVARPDGRFNRLEHDTLEKVCRALDVDPGALFARRAKRR